ncbi:centrosomal protein of 83 kDa-like isoform X1 [Apostichopus japonicus]|uniref:centrosomal protein of 83 kDa-like isoform X1 n=1 Tax=Stichopus japonicus TaxID=307972 RepID=UPI003AB85135
MSSLLHETSMPQLSTFNLGKMDQQNITESLAKLSQETELQKMLADEKMRCDMHKTNYQTLKAEHTRLQNDMKRLQDDLDRVREEKKTAEEKLQSLLTKANKELAEHAGQIADLKSQVLTPQKLELVKLKISEDMEQPFRDRLTQVCKDLDHFREGYNKLRYENTFLKSEYEHEQAERKRVMEEMKSQHEAEIESLRKDKETIIARYSQDNNQDGEKVRNLHRENAQLNLKLKGLLSELNEIRAQREQAGLQSDHVTRLQSRQLSEHATNIKTLETEKNSLKLHMDQLQKELTSSQDEQRILNNKIHDLERQNSELRGQLEETTHQKKLELTNAKMEAVRIRGELEREKDAIVNQLEELKAKVEIAESSLQAQSNLVAEKEKETARKVQSVREEEWEKVSQLETEKLDLDARLQEAEKLYKEFEYKSKQESSELDERVHEAERKQDEAQKEISNLKTKLEQQRSLQEDLDTERNQASKMREKLQQTSAELQSIKALEKQLNHEIEKHRDIIENLRDELREMKYDSERTAGASRAQLEQHKMNWSDERQQYQNRIDNLDKQVKDTLKKVHEQETITKKKKKRYQKIVDRLKDEIQLLQAQKEELETEKQALRNQIPKDTYTKAVRKLRDLQRRHTDFKNLMTSVELSQMPLGAISFTGPTEASTPFNTKLGRKEHLAEIHERLNELGENQRQQMDALIGGALTARTDYSEVETDKENGTSPLLSKMDLDDL